MTIRRQKNLQLTFGRLFMWLMAVILVLRALMPTGFMPDVGAMQGSRFEVAFCTGTGSVKSFTIESAGAPGHSSDSDKAERSASCPFSIMNAAVAMPSADLHLDGIPLLAWITSVEFRQSRHVKMLVQGPPLGSRAPPSTLG
jgi:hypothetical protein